MRDYHSDERMRVLHSESGGNWEKRCFLCNSKIRIDYDTGYGYCKCRKKPKWMYHKNFGLRALV
jgi:uncharacterized Fe-S radical SAM superfamily protein PflX